MLSCQKQGQTHPALFGPRTKVVYISIYLYSVYTLYSSKNSEIKMYDSFHNKKTVFSIKNNKECFLNTESEY